MTNSISWEEFVERPIKGGIPKSIKQQVLDVAEARGIPKQISFQEKMYMIRNGIDAVPTCANPGCSSPVRFQVSVTRYMRYCSQKCSAMSEDTQNKKRHTNLSLYGTQNALNKNLRDRSKSQMGKVLDVHCKSFSHLVVPQFTVDDWKGGMSVTKYPWKCVRCDTHFVSKVDNSCIPLCPKCDKAFTDIEQFVKNILDSLHIEYQPHNRRIIGKEKLELDFYVPSLKVGIETHGLWFHGDKNFPRNYHQHKAQVCWAKGIKLIQIFSDEIKNQPWLVEQKLKRILHISDQCPVIGARKCKIQEVTKAEAKQFLDTNHLQKSDRSQVRYGAFTSDGVLCGVITFCRPRIALGHTIDTASSAWELSRFCTKADGSFPGLFTKMLQHFIRTQPTRTQIFSYADARWTDPADNVYIKSGFAYSHISKPSYYYCKKGEPKERRLHRFGFRKTLLLKKHAELDKAMTEFEMTDLLGYWRVWDAGQHKFVLVIA